MFPSSSPSQYSWCSQVFLDPLSMLSSLFAQSLDALRPPLGTCVQSAVKGSSNSLTTLMELRQVHSVMAHSVAECITACSCFFVICQAALRFVKGLERALASVDGKIVCCSVYGLCISSSFCSWSSLVQVA